MRRRFLLGPVRRDYVERNFPSFLRDSRCRPFDWTGTDAFDLSAHTSWESYRASWPADWSPDYLALYLAYRSIPDWIWQAPLPIVGLAPDWNFLWHPYRQLFPLVDLVVTDTEGAQRFAK